jgi:acyl-CoA thioester hydrolase
MDLFKKEISVRWSDIDPNFHVRHSVYYDFGAQHRVEILESSGLTLSIMDELNIGPVLFREECIYKREIRFADRITINTKMLKMRPDASRWTIEHVFLNSEDKIFAKITVDGAWLDTKTRRLKTGLPQVVSDVFKSFPKSHDFMDI